MVVVIMNKSPNKVPISTEKQGSYLYHQGSYLYRVLVVVKWHYSSRCCVLPVVYIIESAGGLQTYSNSTAYQYWPLLRRVDIGRHLKVIVIKRCRA